MTDQPDPTCPVTMWPLNLVRPMNWHDYYPCGQPAVTKFCAKHEADRVRLGGAA